MSIGCEPTANSSDASNVTAASCGGESAEGPARLILIVVQSIIFSLALLSNSAVLVVLCVYNRRKKLSRMYLFIANLCAADIAVACFNVLPNLLELIAGMEWLVPSDFLCKAVQYGSLAVIYASTYVLVMTAVDRYIAICHPLVSQGAACFKRVHVMVLIAWAAALAFSVPQLVVFRYGAVGEDGEHGCVSKFADDEATSRRYDVAYTVWFVIAVWIVPVVVLAFCYVSITIIVWKNRNFVVKTKEKSVNANRQSSKCVDRRHSRSGLPAATMKTVQLTSTVVSCYIICWSPWMISILYLTASSLQGLEVASADAIAILLSYLIGFNSCINPWIYFCFNYKRLRSARTLNRNDSSCRTMISTAVPMTSPTSYNDMQVGLLSKYMCDGTETGELACKYATETGGEGARRRSTEI